ncbi:MAG: histidine kinase, partial [Glaciihabitans sp.]|nr:histidine kinase [Glaciihabitans sp.]
HTQVQRFEILLADLLEMSRYDAGAVELETEPTNLVRLVEEAIEDVASLADSKGSELRLVAPGGYFEAEVEARRVRRILQNLLGNAIDHGEGKPIVVYVDSDSNAVAIAVRDYGIGMTAAAMSRVFDRFWRADPSRQRTTGGTGLGLAIALEDAALHGGWLEVWSSPGEGSCFRLTIPRVLGTTLRSSPIELPPEDPEVPTLASGSVEQTRGLAGDADPHA